MQLGKTYVPLRVFERQFKTHSCIFFQNALETTLLPKPIAFMLTNVIVVRAAYAPCKTHQLCHVHRYHMIT